jgi:hypothetical protein
LYDLKFNELCNYLKECGRLKDDLDDVPIKTMETGTIPKYVNDKVASVEHDYHLTVKKSTRNEIAKIKCKNYCDKLPSNQLVVYGDMHYGVGMEIRCTNNFKLDEYNKIKNERVYTIEKINGTYI